MAYHKFFQLRKDQHQESNRPEGDPQEDFTPFHEYLNTLIREYSNNEFFQVERDRQQVLKETHE